MKLTSLRVENFRSVKKLDFSVLDPNITTLIGANGSGKSNILKAIVALAGDDSVPTDEEFHAGDEHGEDGQIIIEASFLFDSRDKNLLAETGLEHFQPGGFIAQVVKSREHAVGHNI